MYSRTRSVTDFQLARIQKGISAVVKITNGSAEQPMNIQIHSWHVPWRPCKTDRRLLVALWGSDAERWKGQGVRLTRDPTVTFGPDTVGGIRITAATIDKPFSMQLTASKGKRKPRTVEVLRLDAPDRLANALRDAGWYDDAIAEFGERPTWDDGAVKSWATARKAAQAATP